ncbi:fumarylacetoacetate hydrolase family protein [Pollutimonas thiosulfatoxidans]|uniref:Fumarylacetoacetate hydrolase n=1 Tax=Pollutimonas thiosulfatoxidans TaxID=2028345 RepID=A0A410GD96_9BURK|nr:fumarylacetoacetate hydrolase family protein [Pollutimonas thiosulfatoxidans]QAA94239.1 fumarylacetoacetate hydrolase [Pollutimonas thiosulfatoxidans]
MKLLRFVQNGKEGWAVCQPGRDSWHGTTEDAPAYIGSLDEVIKAGSHALQAAIDDMAAQDPIDLQAVRLLPPLSQPGKIICVGLNYHDHSMESGFEQPDYPTLFSRFSTSLTGHDEPIFHSSLSDTLDFEGELAVVIGKGGGNIARDQALDHVLAYSVFNDGSVREYQFKSPQWMMGKNFDRTGGFGPWLVTADELPAGASGLRLETRLNGVTVQSANTQDMVFDVASLIAILSEAITLEAGDLIVAGTPSGVGHARDPKLYMRPGDVCEVEIEGIGLLRNQIESRAAIQ